jgi:hypothetical protein
MSSTVDPAADGLLPSDPGPWTVSPDDCVLAEARPLRGLDAAKIGGFPGLIITGADPQCVPVDPDSGQALRLLPGAYRLIFQAQVVVGRLSAPKLYVDTGRGFSEDPATTFVLDKHGGGLWHADFRLDQASVALRFDPSETPAKFLVTRLMVVGLRPGASRAYRGWRRALLELGARADSHRWLRPFLWPFGRTLRALALAGDEVALSRLSLANAVMSGPTHPGATAAPHAGGSPHGAAWQRAMAVARGERGDGFVADRLSPVAVDDGEPKILAAYLPQYHPIPENDAAWGKGFTEWTNVAKAVPQYVGHRQPRMPGELGFYDLRVRDVMARQVALARQYGLSGFCFHYYWFDGKRLLERPLDLFLGERGDDFRFDFCLCWANENWTRRWDGADEDILIGQNHSVEDSRRVFADMLRYILDPRYIRVDGKPVIVIYRPAIIPDIAEVARMWRDEAAKAGLPGLYLVATNAFGFGDPRAIGFDALCQFPPHAVMVQELTDEVERLNPDFAGHVYSYEGMKEAYLDMLPAPGTSSPGVPVWPGLMTAWDNEARKPGRGHSFHGAMPASFRDWVERGLDYSRAAHDPGARFVFVNAWNEWGEGSYLEPDRDYGYAWLEAIAATRTRPVVDSDPPT